MSVFGGIGEDIVCKECDIECKEADNIDYERVIIGGLNVDWNSAFVELNPEYKVEIILKMMKMKMKKLDEKTDE